MPRSALGVAVSLFAFAVALPNAQASSSSGHSGHRHKRPAVHHASRARTSRAHLVSSGASSVRHVAYSGGNESFGEIAGLDRTPDPLALKSNEALVIDQNTSRVLFEKNSGVALPIASLTKLMTALVVVEAHQDMGEVLRVTKDDIDHIKHTSSRLRIGSRLSRANMLHIALMSSENRAASALGRNYPGGLKAFVAAMNAKAKELGMFDTHYVEPTGLSSDNVSSARDLAKLVMAAYQEPLIRKYSTDTRYSVNPGGYVLNYMSSNRLVLHSDWEIGLQKTGFINEAGHCLVLQSKIENRPVVMVFLDSQGKYSRFGDAVRVRDWIEHSKPQMLTDASSPQS